MAATFAAPATIPRLPQQRPRTCRRRRPPPSAFFLEAAHTAPEFVAHVAASCGAALFGVMGARATRAPRALMTAKVAAKRRAKAEESLLRRARRAQLAENAGKLGANAQWGDVAVDEPDNRIISFSQPAAITSGDSPFALFDQRLRETAGDSPPSKALPSRPKNSVRPAPSEFLDADDNAWRT